MSLTLSFSYGIPLAYSRNGVLTPSSLLQRVRDDLIGVAMQHAS